MLLYVVKDAHKHSERFNYKINFKGLGIYPDWYSTHGHCEDRLVKLD